MLPNELIDILEKYKDDNSREINCINKDISDIKNQLKTIRTNLARTLSIYTNNDLEDNRENELFNDLKKLRTIINSIEPLSIKDNNSNEDEVSTILFDKRINVNLLSDDICPSCNQKLEDHNIYYQRVINGTNHKQTVTWHRCPECKKMFVIDYEIEQFDFANTNISLHKNYYEEVPDINIGSVIVLSNTQKCSLNHKTKDIVAKLPTIDEQGNLIYHNLMASYCFDCNRFTILKDDFNEIRENAICRIIDETTEASQKQDNEMEIAQKNSILYNYGYNVKTKSSLSDKQRQVILASVIEAEIMNRRDIINHLNGLISRGSKIPSWSAATQKWTQDKEYVRFYENGSLPQVIFDEVILKYKKLAK